MLNDRQVYLVFILCAGTYRPSINTRPARLTCQRSLVWAVLTLLKYVIRTRQGGRASSLCAEASALLSALQLALNPMTPMTPMSPKQGSLYIRGPCTSAWSGGSQTRQASAVFSFPFPSPSQKGQNDPIGFYGSINGLQGYVAGFGACKWPQDPVIKYLGLG